MPYIVVYDANALFGNTQRDLLLRIGQQRHLVQAKWTQQILDEMTRAIRERYPSITEEKAARLQGLINDSVADCLVRLRAAHPGSRTAGPGRSPCSSRGHQVRRAAHRDQR